MTRREIEYQLQQARDNTAIANQRRYRADLALDAAQREKQEADQASRDADETVSIWEQRLRSCRNVTR